MRRIYQETHYETLYKRYNQPRSTGDYPDIAYHILVGSDGWAWQRDPSIPGYHASNYEVNTNGLGICVSGNYDTMMLNSKMNTFYREAVADARAKFPSLNKCNGHRAYANKSCPGGTFTDEFIKSVFEGKTPSNAKVKKHIGDALNDLSKAINEL